MSQSDQQSQPPQADCLMLGAGSWGTALACHLATQGHRVVLWGRDPDHIQAMQHSRVNERYLPDVSLPAGIHFEADLETALGQARDWILAVPSQAFSDFLPTLKAHATPDQRIAWVSKGLDPSTHRPLHETVAAHFPNHPLAVLTGPSLAAEVAVGLPTAVTVAGTDPAFTTDLQHYFHAPHFRVYQNDDLCGVELCGALKNVLAIASGLSDGLGFGANARAALITRGMVEMGRLCDAVGGQASTLNSLAGVGDLILTSTDDRSRNRRFGLALGQGLSSDEALEKIGQVVEGRVNCAHAYALAQELQIDAPITTQIYRVLYEDLDPSQAARSLQGRLPKSE